MTDAIEVSVDRGGATHLVGRCHYLARRRGQSLVFEYADAWRDRAGSFALDPANLPLERQWIYSPSNKSALSGVLRDTTPDHWGRQLMRRAFRKAGEQRAFSEIDYIFVIDYRTRIGALRYRREDEEAFDHRIGRCCVPHLIRLQASAHQRRRRAVQHRNRRTEVVTFSLPIGGNCGIKSQI